MTIKGQKRLEKAEAIEKLIQKHRKKLVLGLPQAQAPVAQNESNEKLCLSVSETAVALGISTRSVERAIKRGEMPSKRVGRRILIPKSELKLAR